ncbi:MAG: hypothetical protein KAH86_09395, partial [Methanosarcinales archaeon]|nr:hypothetical protein [Methanosarcinales archaeon]
MYQLKVENTILAIFIFMVLFTISAAAVGDNSACANNQCHGDIVSKYSTTSHNLCTDCHNKTSTYPHTEAPISEPGDCSSCHTNEVSNFNSSKHGYMGCSSCHDVHGNSTIYKSLRKNLEIPLISNYYSNADFEICYMCHSEANLMQMPDPDASSLLYQSTFGIPVFSGPFATDFRKMTSAWWDVDLSLPGFQSNLHYDHIGRFRGSGTAQWDPEGGNNKSFESCITCHNPHGSASPRLTVT